MIAAFIFLIVVLSGGVNSVDKRIEYPELLQMIEKGEIDRVSVRGYSLVGRLKDSRISRSDYPARAYDFETTIGPDFYDTVLTMRANQLGKDIESVSVQDLGFELEYLAPVTTPWYLELIPYLIPIVLLLAVLFVCLGLGMNEGLAALVSIIALVPYYIVLYLKRDQLKKRFEYSIE